MSMTSPFLPLYILPGVTERCVRVSVMAWFLQHFISMEKQRKWFFWDCLFIYLHLKFTLTSKCGQNPTRMF